MSEVIKTYKGFDKDLRCRGFQYEIGKEYTTQNAKACDTGFHACEQPIEVFGYYAPGTSRYCVVEQSGKLDRGTDDSKVASSHIKIGAEIGIPGIVKAQIEYVKAHTTTEHTDPEKATAGEYGAATAGEYGAATAGNRGAATAGEYGAATAGEYGAATSRGKSSVGEEGLAVARGNGVRVKGGLGAVLVLCEEETGNYKVASYKVEVVDGERIKANTWYALVNGEFKEASNE